MTARVLALLLSLCLLALRSLAVAVDAAAEAAAAATAALCILPGAHLVPAFPFPRTAPTFFLILQASLSE